MADVNANIGVNIDTSSALAQLKSLQRQISQFHASIAKSSEAASLAQRDLQRNFLSSINALGSFSAELRNVRTTSESFTNSLEKNKFSMREYFRYAGASTKTFGKLFKSEYDTIGRVAEDRVKKLQTQYIKMGRDASGAMKAIAVIPNQLDMDNLATQTQIASQKQALFNQLVKQGSTNLLNFGKNTQWAGRQLMVGFTLPLMAVGAAASKTFMDMEQQALKFRKVYGDLFTPQEETEQALANIQALGREFTKYGVAVADTVALAADAAAAGFQGIDLQRQTTEATRLSVLGQIDNQQALETTIALQNAFKISSEELAQSIDFLNAVENQTVVSLDDITTAIPKVAPVIQQLGGDVKDLAFFLTAMKEGGINASEGANALKSGLASLINPTTRAREMLQGLGIDIVNIVNQNKGDIKGTVIGFAQALDTLAPLERARAIEQMFGKFQFARLSALFSNVTREGTQASRVLNLASASVEDLASLSEQELGKTADSAMNKFRKSVEDLKFAIVPVGEAFLKAITPIIDFVSGVAEKFANLSDGTKKAITIMVTVIGGLGPVLLMTFGLLANGVANIIKLFLTLRMGYQRLTGQSQNLGEQTQYMTMEQIDAAAAAHSLNQAHANLTQQFTVETNELQKLIAAYQAATTAATRFASMNPGMMVPPRKKFSEGGIVTGPGGPTDDQVPIMASNGEAVLTAKTVKDNKEIVDSLLKTGTFAPKLDLSGPSSGVLNTNPGQINRLVSGGAGVVQRSAEEIEQRRQQQLARIEANRARRASSLQAMATKPVVSSGPRRKRQSSEEIPVYQDFAVRLQDAATNQAQRTTAESAPNVLAPLAARVSEARGQLGSGLDEIIKEYEGVTGRFVDELNKEFERTATTITDESERFAKAWQHAGKTVEKEVNSITSDADKGAIRKVFGLDEDQYGTIATDMSFKHGFRGRKKRSDSGAASYTDSKFKKATKAAYKKITGKDATGMDLGHVFDVKTRKKMGMPTSVPLSELEQDPKTSQASLNALKSSIEKYNAEYDAYLADVDNKVKAGAAKTKKSAGEVAEEAVKSTAKAAGVKSPSKKTIPVGEDIARGLEVGMNNRKDDVARTAGSLADTAVKRTRRAATRPQGAPGTDNMVNAGSASRRRAATRPQGPSDVPTAILLSKVQAEIAAERKRAADLARAQAKAAADQIEKQKQLALAAEEEAKARQASVSKMGKLNNVIQGGSFALMSLSGIAQMFGGRLGAISNVIFTVSGALFALQTVTQLLTQAKALELAATRANTIAQGLGAANFKGLFTGVVGFKNKLSIAAKFLSRFAGIAGTFAASLGITVLVFKQLDNARNRELEKINGLSDAIAGTTKQIKTLGDFFGVVPTQLPFDSKRGNEIVAPEVRSQREQLKLDPGFQSEFKNTIKTLSTATAEEAQLVFSSLALKLKAQGFATQQVQTIIDALREESGKTDVVIDVKSLNLSPESIQKLQGQIAVLFAAFTKSSKIKPTGMEKFISGFLDKMLGRQPKLKQFTAETERALNGITTFMAETAKSSAGMFQMGLIDAKTYTASLDGVIAMTNNLDAANRKLVLTKVFESMGTGAGALLAGLKSAKEEAMALALLSSGVLDKDSSIFKALMSKDAKTRGRGQNQLAKKYNALLGDVTKATSQKPPGTIEGGGTTTGSDVLSKEAKLVIARMQKELDALKTKRDLINETNDKLKRQYDYQQKIMQLSQDEVQAKISGNYIGAAMIGQQKAFEKIEFNKETESLALDKKITMLENRISALQAGERVSAAERAVIKAKSKGKAMGGLIRGPGTGRSDSILAGFSYGGLPQLRVSNGEYIVQARSVQKYGVDFMDSINQGNVSTSNQSTQQGNTVYNIDMVINGGDAVTIADQVIRRLKVETSKNNKSNMVVI